MKKIILILGLPCSGKSTLAKVLSKCLNINKISIGDILRSYTQSNPQFLKSREFLGHKNYSNDFIEELLLKNPLFAGSDYLILDGGYPLNVVLKKMNCRIISEIFIDTSDATRLSRFKKRSIDSQRLDDSETIFKSRSKLYQSNLHNLLADRTSLFTIKGDNKPNIILKQALQIAMLTSTNSLRSFLIPYTKPLYFIDSNYRLDTDTKIYYQNTHKFNIHPSKDLLILIKPGIIFSNKIINIINEKLTSYGFEIFAVRVIDPSTCKDFQFAEIHLNNHFLYRKFPEFLLERNLLQTNLGLVDKNDEHSMAQKIRDGLWIHKADGIKAVNNHVPKILKNFWSGQTVALHIKSISPLSSEIKQLRTCFLGQTDPYKAFKGSLRNLGYYKHLGNTIETSFESNGFHLSSGYLEGVREIEIWFGEHHRSSTIEQPYEINGILFDNYSNTDNSIYDITRHKNYSEVKKVLEKRDYI
ncbi:AAA family ATPase [Listeria booriae]|uniref:nucleoside monophosphate kinase n=1 Tax=Listeria booriae TaxID=1552123 RepID=UPI0016231FD6|nr:nucleoside monophosphate kinase [Listeria booriae]MBC1230288.1 AAA family ATPase [Listeria booriae]